MKKLIKPISAMAFAALLYVQPSQAQSLKDMFKDSFDIGAAIDNRQAYGTDREGKAHTVLAKHFNSITPENLMKWGSIHPRPDTYLFEPMDRLVNLADSIGARVIGHTLVWHNQTPDWVFEDENGERLSESALIERMEKHIETVMGRYKGRVFGYDVVNEAIFDNGEYRTSKWFEASETRFIKKAFAKAEAVDPEAELYYNDYNMWKPEKRETAIKLAKEIREEGIRIDGIGLQGHYGLESPSLEEIEASILRIAEEGFKVMFTEVDIDVLPNPVNRHGADIDATFEFDEKYNLYTDGLPDEVHQKLLKRYVELFELFKKHEDKITRVTFWGIHDGGNWLNNWPMRGRTAYPLLFDRQYEPKMDIIEAIQKVVNQ
ncbi:endo-1,4-beta-xylanase [Belliella kenyensis]|uniref:Beta-xylanase n=1 Tax=Belliella kenyensis TaxID=1472724 RepID=A0ABV8EQC7_9BACT|nr:endo-1,4-beta-xylanase [Belliella kenyensis]MCH7402021.1 endo-1,4-beta-xylanase [Belliella kenyensis]MDN3605185.1 endo-1,4-beta-xylanase [Belliella kenyensis]